MTRIVSGEWSASSDQEAIQKGAKYALRSLTSDGRVYSTDYHADRAAAERHGQIWVECGGGGYRIDELVMQA